MRNVQVKVVEKSKTYILCSVPFFFQKFYRLRNNLDIYGGFGGLGVACWPLVLKYVEFLGRKNPQHAFLRRRRKAVGPMS